MLLDFTHILNNETPVYPGTLAPKFKDGNTIEKDGFAEINLSMCTHTGTHIDAPCHILKNTKSLDGFSIDKFIGSAIVLDCSQKKEISLEFVLKNEQIISNINFILFYTGW